MTWIEVADTAIKIGLGALITGLLSLLNTNKTSSNQIKIEKKNRYYQISEQVSKKLESKLNYIFHLGIPVTSNLDEYSDIRNGKDYTNSLEYLRNAIDEFDGLIVKLGGKLRLLSLTNSADRLEGLSNDLYYFVDNDMKFSALENKFRDIVYDVNQEKKKFYATLYREIEEKTK